MPPCHCGRPSPATLLRVASSVTSTLRQSGLRPADGAAALMIALGLVAALADKTTRESTEWEDADFQKLARQLYNLGYSAAHELLAEC